MPDETIGKYRDLSVRQTEVLAQIAMGVGLPRARSSILSALELKGLIERCGDKVPRLGRFGTTTVPQYETPTHEHVPFIAWLADRHDSDVGCDERNLIDVDVTAAEMECEK